MSHTTGPYSVGKSGRLGTCIYAGNSAGARSRILALVTGVERPDHDDNVRLFVAAPDLLAAAEFVVEHADKSYPPELVMQAEYAVARARREETES